MSKARQKRRTRAGMEMANIALLTLNPAVDITYTVPHLIADQKAHALATRFDPGGNGINIGRGLMRLNRRADNFCVIAGETGHLLERLLQHHLETVHYERVTGETRINGTILEQDSGTQYEVSGVGPTIPPGQLQALLDAFVQHASAGFGVLTGSTPPDISDGLYADMILRIREAGGLAVVDAHHEVLRRAIMARPFLIKPNRHELETLIDRELPTLEAVAEQARNIQRQGVDYICVSLGAEGAILVGPQNSYYAAGVKVKVRSTVGAGDSMLAGLLAGFVQGLGSVDTLRLAVACGTGTVQQPGTELFHPDMVKRLVPEISIREMSI